MSITAKEASRLSGFTEPTFEECIRRIDADIKRECNYKAIGSKESVIFWHYLRLDVPPKKVVKKIVKHYRSKGFKCHYYSWFLEPKLKNLKISW